MTLAAIGETDYLFMALGFEANSDMLDWANDILSEYPAHIVILATHDRAVYQLMADYQNTPKGGNGYFVF